MQIITPDQRPAKLNKANARDVAKARAALAMGEGGIYARSLSAIHRSSSAQQQREVEWAIAADGAQHLFARHPNTGALVAA
ncbi:hypothetical protein [Sphingobium sp. EP60837]|uniref:hypothetical protein n=1 Tax=Sphingobium sp. EP60837 TaxID=1855519 RepID=UPI0007DD8080|nr:hypothetical protein [Sphingobium sp. EP60837]ANI79039.1 hypothetical protein EP837_02644 [Sphingobium sp. EP60837]